MFVETDSLVVVSVEQTFAVQLCLVDQPRKMNVSAESLIRAAWQQLLHVADQAAGSGRAKSGGCSSPGDAAPASAVGRSSASFRPTLPITRSPPNIPPFPPHTAFPATPPS